MILDVHHVGIAVKDLDAALALYRDSLGLPLVKEGDVPGRGVRGAVVAAGRSYLELLQPISDGSPFARYIEERGEGLHHLALWSDDVEADVARLRELAVPLADHEPREGFNGRLSYLQPQAFDGALLEVVQPFDPSARLPPGSPQWGGGGLRRRLAGARSGDRTGFAEDRPEPLLAGEGGRPGAHVKRIDHVVLRVPDVRAVGARFQACFGVATKRSMERGGHRFAFLRPGDVVIEVIGPREGGDPNSGRIAGLALDVSDIDDLTAQLKAKGFPIGEPHAALQGGRIVSVHHSGACGVPLAFIDFSDSPSPPSRG